MSTGEMTGMNMLGLIGKIYYQVSYSLLIEIDCDVTYRYRNWLLSIGFLVGILDYGDTVSTMNQINHLKHFLAY